MARKGFRESEVSLTKRKFRKAQLDKYLQIFEKECSKFISASKFKMKNLEDVFELKKMKLKLVGAQDSNFYIFEDIEEGYHYIIDRRQVQDYFLLQVDPEHKTNWINHKYKGGFF